MEQREIGKSGLKVSAIGLGCNNFGSLIDAHASNAVIAKALDLGVTFFDTADIYGQSEDVLGKALGARRKSVVIATKFGMVREGFSGGASRAYVITAVERSLGRLRTNYIDVLYLHKPDPTVPIEETLGVMNELIRQGKVRHAAASNMTPDLLNEAAVIAAAQHLSGFIATQEQYSILVRGIEQAVLPAVQKLGMALIPYFPLASGLLTGKYKRGEAPAAGTRLHIWKQLGTSLLTEANFDRVERLEAFASARRRKASELAIAWLLAKPNVPSVIAGATSAAQIEANARAVSFQLTQSELADIDGLL